MKANDGQQLVGFSIRMSTMQAAIHTDQSIAIAFDADVLKQPDKKYFDPAYWRALDAVTATAQGRGNSFFVDAPFGAVVLRKYLRGGCAARISRDRYLYTGLARSRPFQEFSTLVALSNLGLPVSRPVAAMCEHKGLISRGALMTHAISNAITLADVLQQSDDAEEQVVANSVEQTIWRNVGRCIRRFHAAGVWHADLNARNILIDKGLEVFLIDFDRARLTPGQPVEGTNNLARLKRSIQKISAGNHKDYVTKHWMALMAGYDD